MAQPQSDNQHRGSFTSMVYWFQRIFRRKAGLPIWSCLAFWLATSCSVNVTENRCDLSSPNDAVDSKFELVALPPESDVGGTFVLLTGNPTLQQLEEVRELKPMPRGSNVVRRDAKIGFWANFAVTRDVMRCLRKIPQIKWLDLFSVEVGAEEVRELELMQGLETLIVRGSSVDPADFPRLVASRVLRQFLLSHCLDISDGAMLRIGECSKLQALSIMNCPLITGDFLRFIKHPLYAIEFAGCQNVSPLSLQNLVHPSSVKSLIVRQCEFMNGTKIWDGLAHLKALDRFEFSSTKWFPFTISTLEELPALRELNLRDTTISDRELASCRLPPTLQTIDLSGTVVSDAGLRCLERCQQLKDVMVSGTNISERSLEFLGSLPNVRVLDIRRCERLEDYQVEVFMKQYPNVTVMR